MPGKAKYVIKRKDRRVDEVIIESEGLTIGRLSGNDLVLNHRTVDPTHTGIKEIDGEYWLFNLSNSNGIVVNHRLIDKIALSNGDSVQLGPYLLTIETLADGLSVTVEVSVGSRLIESRSAEDSFNEVGAPAGPSARTRVNANLDEQTLSIFWEKRKREAGKIAQITPLHPSGRRRMGKALSNWFPTLDLQQPWRYSYFIWAGLVVGAFSLVTLVSYVEVFSPGEISDIHRAGRRSGLKVAPDTVATNDGSCSKCHAITATIDSKCAGCHQTPHFQPAISDPHRREGIGCTGCHSEHQGGRSEDGLLNPAICTFCHNGQYLIKSGSNAGKYLAIPHGGGVGYPIKDSKWSWKGLTKDVWAGKQMPAVLAARPASEQFHAIHRAIYLPSGSGKKMNCRDCHAASIPRGGERDLSPQNACAICHAQQIIDSQNSLGNFAGVFKPDCAGCHQPHGRSRVINEAVASVKNDYSDLKRLMESRQAGASLHAEPFPRLSSFGQGGADVYRHRQSLPSWQIFFSELGAMPWYLWIALLVFIPVAGLLFLSLQTLRQRNDLEKAGIGFIDGKSQLYAGDVTQTKRVKSYDLVYPHPVVDPLLCIGCHACVEACPHDVLDIVNGVATPVSLDQCMEDTSCMVECPTSPKACVVINTSKVIPPRKVPQRNQSLMTNVPGLYLIGDLSGVPLIKNAVNEGAQVVDYIIEDLQKEGHFPEADYDVAIIGIGPGGLSATIVAKQRGLKYLALEQDKVAGTIQGYPAGKYVFFKPDTVQVKGVMPLDGAGGIKEDLLDSWISIIDQFQIVINEEERCSGMRREAGVFVINTEKIGGSKQSVYKARKVILAIGTRGTPMKLGAPGETLKIKSDSGEMEDKVKYKLSDPNAYLNKKCIIVGAGNSAIEAAVALSGFKREGDKVIFTRSNEVTLVIRSDFKGDLKLGNKMDIYDCIDSGKVNVMFRTAIKEIKEEEVVLIDAGTKTEKTRIQNDYIFALIGGEKPTKFLEEIGIKIG